MERQGQQTTEFEEMVSQRQQEKRLGLREKLRIKSNEIRMRKLVNLDPFPDGTFEILDRHNIWSHVLSFLTHMSDITSAALSCRTFFNILEKKRKGVLFPQALAIVKEHASRKRKGDGWWEAWIATGLNARLVCKDWKKHADVLLFEENFVKPEWYIRSTINYSRIIGESDELECVFHDEEQIDQLIKTLPIPELSQAIFRRFKFILFLFEGTIDIVFCQKVLDLLCTFGKYVWALQIVWYHNTGFPDSCQWLSKMLNSMPNLRELCLYDLGWSRESQTEIMNRIFFEHPFPRMQSLEQLTCKSSINKHFVTEVLRKSENLKSINITPFQELTDEIKSVLSRLSLSCFGYNSSCLNALSNQTTWALKAIKLGPELELLQSSALIALIQRYQNSLEYLDLQGLTVLMNTNNFYLSIPNLKTFGMPTLRSINLYAQIHWLDNLLPLQSLEEIMITNVDGECEDCYIKVKENYLAKEVEKSVIWKCFPNMICFVIGKTKYYRMPLY